jgi:dolichyl-phosphate beta-glucosyltransferase
VSGYPGTLTIVIPAWNEARRLESAPLEQFLDQHPLAVIQFVDDGSTDYTFMVLEALRVLRPSRVRILRLARNVGKGEAVRQGLLRAMDDGCEMAGYLDADLAAPAESMLLLAEQLRSDPRLQCAFGSRVKLLGWQIQRSERRHYLGRLFATCASITLGLPVYDTQCGAKVLRSGDEVRAMLRDSFLSRWLFDVELMARIRDRFGAQAMHEVPLPVWQDRGNSSVRLLDMIRAPLELWRISRRYPARSSAGRRGVQSHG